MYYEWSEYIKNLIESVYCPPRKRHNRTIEAIYSPNIVVKYSLARYAILRGLEALKLNKTSSVLIPSFICRDVLAPFNLLGINIIFYEIDENLNPRLTFDELPKADAIMAVHYFGLESNIDYFKEYCKKWNAFLIEDNAHGLFSRSRNGFLLGTNGDVGVISVRKSLPIENGAILLSKSELRNEIIETNNYISLRLRVKNFIRPLVAFLGINFLKKTTEIKRKIRSLVLGSAIPESLNYEETEIRYNESPYQFDEYFLTVDIEKEMERRVKLFNDLNEAFKALPARRIRQNLTPGEIPYVYPFICETEKLSEINEFIETMGLEIVKWPSLPNIVKISPHPGFYENVYLVKFIW